MDRITYKIILDDYTKRRVRGVQITEHFAAHQSDAGWAVTHLLTGRALVLSFFKDIADAKSFAQGYETVFDGALDEKEVNYSTKNAHKVALAHLADFLNSHVKTYTLSEIGQML